MSTERSSGWVGVDVFAGVVILMSGLFSGFQGLVALIGPNAYYAVARGSLFVFDVNGWGWWNLIVGIVFVLVGIALLTGAGWAQIVAIILAILSAIGQLFLIPVQPWWAVIVIARRPDRLRTHRARQRVARLTGWFIGILRRSRP
jgi:hypothetical protein